MIASAELDAGVLPPSVRGTPIFFGNDRERLFGFYLEPSAETPKLGRAVLFSNPFGYEAMCLHRTYRALASELASRGFPVLRYDHPGTGDSGGTDLSPGRVEAWIGGLVCAADELRARSGAKEIALFGVRLGATLGLLAGARIPDLVATVAWAPHRSGKELLREVRAFRLLKGLPPPDLGDEGAEEAAGYVLSAETCRALATLDLAKPSRPPASRVLLLARDDISDDGRVATVLREKGVVVTKATPSGYAAMMQDAYESVVPRAAVLDIAGWLEQGAPKTTIALGPPPGASQASFHSCRGPLVEEAIFFGPQGRLFGVLTRAAAESHERPAVILINTGSNHHVGPNRLHVTVARRLAGEGFHVLRMDISGVGDSLVRPGGRENHLYSARAPEDVQAAMDALSARTHTSRFVLVGICSGAYVAFHTSLADHRVAEQILVNLQTFDFRDGDSLVLRKCLFGRSTRAYRRLLFHPRTWWRFLKGSLDVRWVVRVLLHRAYERVRQHASALRSLITYGRYEHSDVARRLKDLDDRGVATLLVYDDDDGGLDTIEQHLGPNARAMRSRSRFGMRIVSGADHTFTPVSSQPKLLDLVSSELARRFPPASPGR